MKFAVIVDNGGGPNLIYHDVEGEVYTFPTNYRLMLLPGTKVVYQRSGKTDEQPIGLTRLMDDAHYFATAVIDEVSMTADGNLRATIKDFVRFRYPVPFRKFDGSHWETAPGQFWRNGVRVTDKVVYDSIVEASNTPPIPVAVAKRGVGVRSTKVLSVGVSSKPFAMGKYEVVTAKDGYYILSKADGVYYQLVKMALANYLRGAIQVMCSKSGKAYYVQHVDYSSTDIGFIEILDHGVTFSGKVKGKAFEIKIMM